MKTLLPFLALLDGVLQAAPVLSPQFASSYSVGTFASGLDFPVGMTTLPDGSFLVGETTPPAGVVSGQYAYYDGVGEVVRITDSNSPGVAVASNLPGAVTGVMSLGDGLIAVSTVVENTASGDVYNVADITFLQAGSDPNAAWTNAGSIHVGYPSGGSAAALLPTVAQSGPSQYTIYFGLNALYNDGTPGPPVYLSGLANGSLAAGSLDSITVQTSSGLPVVTAIDNLATGIRNSSRPVVDAAGDVYFGDNGYDNNGAGVSADEFNILPAGASGAPFYGYPGNYTDVNTGAFVGGQGIPPDIAFVTPLGGSAPAGFSSLALAPASFPDQCVFAGFHGEYTVSGTSNGEDPVLCLDPSTGTYSTLMPASQAGLNHPDNLYSTNTQLFVENMFTGDFQAGTGEIDVVTANANTPEPATGLPCLIALGMGLAVLRIRQRI